MAYSQRFIRIAKRLHREATGRRFPAGLSLAERRALAWSNVDAYTSLMERYAQSKCHLAPCAMACLTALALAQEPKAAKG